MGTGDGKFMEEEREKGNGRRRKWGDERRLERKGRRKWEKGRNKITCKGIKGNMKMRESNRRAGGGGRVSRREAI